MNFTSLVDPELVENGFQRLSLHMAQDDKELVLPPSSSSRPTYPYLQALLGDNPPTPGLFEHASSFNNNDISYSNGARGSSLFPRDNLDGDGDKRPCVIDLSSELDLFYGHSRRNRIRSLSMSAVGSGGSLSVHSPLRCREHTSEAGSPTMEQVFLMQRSSSPTNHDFSASSVMPDFSSSSGSPGDGGLYSSILTNPCEDPDMDPPEINNNVVRPSFADIFGIDKAVEDAIQNLQSLREKQVAIHSKFETCTSSTNLSDVTLSSFTPSNTRYKKYSTNSGQGSDPHDLERAARLYRSAASHCEANCTWSGQLPHRTAQAAPNSSYSTKIFLGGVPWDISEPALVQAFAEFGEVKVEWPGRDYTSPPKGYLYLVFEDETDVKALLAKCSQDFNTKESYYYKIFSKRMRAKDKEVQIIPWVLSDSNYVRCPSPRLDPQKTVFVGALHGMMTAQALAMVFNDLFGGVVYAGLDTDKYKYPIGSGRVTFNNSQSYMKAVSAAFIEIKTPRFSKKVQVDPYLEDTLCSVCTMKQGPYFCREKTCFNYFCHGCWDLAHGSTRPQHKPLMRNIRGITRARANYQQQQQDYSSGGGRFRGQDSLRNFSDYFSQSVSLQ